MKILVTEVGTGKFLEMRSSGDIQTVHKDHNESPNVDVRAITDEGWDAIESDLRKPTAKQVARARMDATLSAGCGYGGVVYQCNLDDIDQFSRGLSLMNLVGLTSVECRAMDNTMHTLTAEAYRELCITLGAKYEAALRTYWAEIDNQV